MVNNEKLLQKLIDYISKENPTFYNKCLMYCIEKQVDVEPQGSESRSLEKLVMLLNTNFYISIDDNYVEYKYPLELSSENSIDKIHSKICEALNCRKLNGYILRLT